MSLEVKVEFVNELEEEDGHWIDKMRERLRKAASKDNWEGIQNCIQRSSVEEFFIVQEEPIILNNGSTIFHVLASHGCDATLKRLLTKTLPGEGMSENKANRNGDTTLHLAVAKGHYSTVEVLLEKGKVGKDLHGCNGKGETVFHVASNRRHSGRILMLLWSYAEKEWKNKTLDLHGCLDQKDIASKRTFFHRLVAGGSYSWALEALHVLDKIANQEVQRALEESACESEDAYGDTALILLLKKESSFFATKRGKSDVNQEVDQQFNGNQPSGAKNVYEWRQPTSTPARLLVKLMCIWFRVKESESQVTVSDTLLLYLGNAGIVNELHPFFNHFQGCVQMTKSRSSDNVLQIAARDRMTKFIEWFERIEDTYFDWAEVIRGSHDDQGRTALHYAAMTAPHHVAHAMGGFATEIKQDHKWFKRIEAIMPPDLVSKKSGHVNGSEDAIMPPDLVCKKREHANGSKDEQGKTAEELFILLRKDKAQKHGDSARAMATAIMSLVAAVAFATTFTLPQGLGENSGKLKQKDVLRFTSFVCAYVLGLSFAATTILTSLLLYQSPFTVKHFYSSIPRLFRLCVGNLFVSLLLMLVAFGYNLQSAFERYDMAKFSFLYALIFVGPLFVALVYNKFMQIL